MFGETQKQMKINWLNHITSKKQIISTYEKDNNNSNDEFNFIKWNFSKH